MNNLIQSALPFSLICLIYLLASPLLPAEVSALLKIAPILFLCALSIKSGVNSFSIHLLAALLFSMGGDVLLELDLFIPGLVSFLFAQLIYGGLFQRCRLHWTNRPAVSLLLVGFSVVMGSLMWAYAGEMRIPVLVYLLVIAFMGLSANTSRIAGVTLGAGIFILSDSLIAINRFVFPLPAADWLIMSSYYLAQFYLVTSILKLKYRAANSSLST